KGANKYVLDGKLLKAFGDSKVPDEVAALLNVDDANFQRQLDLHFWFNETPGQLAKALNKIVNLELIDRSLAEVGKRLRTGKSELEVCRQRFKQAKTDRRELAWVDELAAGLESLESKQDSLKNLVDK